MRHLLLLFAAISSAFAFSDTHPVVAWSSFRISALERLVQNHVVDSSICDADAVMLIDHPGVRAPDLRQLSSSSALSSALLSSPSSFQSPYLHQPPGYAFPNLATSISNACGSKVVASDLGQLASTTLDPRLKHTIFLRLPNAFHTTSKGDISDIDSTLYSDLSHMASVYPNHIVVYSGGEHDGIVKRQDMKEVFTSADGGLLKRYQLLSPALITALLVTFFILIPTIFFGVNALSSIQSPLRGEVGKGFNAVEKKNQ